jgi:hypothetical protein
MTNTTCTTTIGGARPHTGLLLSSCCPTLHYVCPVLHTAQNFGPSRPGLHYVQAFLCNRGGGVTVAGRNDPR